ncbi:MAG TPA: polynucleotide adenylyltransferase PcnB [Deltaproteobacteria bacterium]|nr:polynucleotide adenylyltransferase PcnB [Deltaproteobacteria bacterium]HPJ95003.1 polynucleotide adenylyltransferase PcnB [Deltaproteobacteria bacterium]HPR51755.1 polynucleotide adenylyltransferase PcnB [Deltaproteobacteria bacterium]
MTKTEKMENKQPVILERQNHKVSRKQIDPDALKVLYRLYRHGYKAYLVGGAVRDLLLGKSPKDFDVVTDARPGQIKKLFANCFLIGRRFRLAHIRFRGGKIIEVATFRKEPDDPADESSDRNNTFGTPIEDAFRRDITINGLFYDISNFSIIDFVGGLEDIQRGRACIIGNPQERFVEDPVRMWRVIRHASRLEFTIEKATADAIAAHKDLLKGCSGARLFEELNKDMGSGFSSPLFRLFIDFGVMSRLFGTIGACVEQSPRVAEKLLALLQVADSSVKSNTTLSQEARFTLLFWPWAETVLSSRDARDIDKMQLLHDTFSESDMPIVIPKGLKAGIIQTICIVERMCRAMESGRMRWSLKKRSRYVDASLVFSIVHTTGILPVRDPFEHIFREKYNYSPTRRRKRRYRNKARRSAPGSETS